MRHLIVAALSFAACHSSPPPPLNLPESCQPLLGGADCLLPYPSDFHTQPASTATGLRIHLGPGARLKAVGGVSADPNLAFPSDGFSPVNPIVALLGVELTDEGFAHLADAPEKSLSANTSHTLIVAPDGTPVPHFADLDPRATDLTKQALVLHPIVPLADQTRYSVFVFGVKSKGALAATPEGFRRIRDDDTGGEAALAPQSNAWKTRLSPLAKKLGIETSQLQLAWEFTTGSQASAAQDMLRVRELTLAWLSTHTPTVTITSVDDAPYDDTWKVIHGTLSMPLFVDSVAVGASLVRDAEGVVTQRGEGSFPFIAVVPNTVRDATGPEGTLLYGHGFFGGFGELTGGSARGLANGTGRTLVAAEWWGMATPDAVAVGAALISEPSQVMQFAERVPQGMANFIVLSDAIERVFPSLPAFQRTDGTAFVDGDASSYLGISQGTILGVCMVGMNPYVEKAGMEVGGSAFTAMMFRAIPFKDFLGFLEMSLPDPLDQQKYVALMQRSFDRIDPNTYARYLKKEPLAGSPDRKVLLQLGLGDGEVPNFASWLLARAIGVEQLQPTPSAIWGIDPAGASPSFAMEVYDFGVDVVALYARAEPGDTDTPVHEGIRKLRKTVEQLQELYDQGTISHHCDGPCDPE